ncbi:RES domain-containing protein [Candidatus Ornithobacterium hominis]|uniref:immunity 49 family protein n=1 Tax=Candidatus Ornithobacterium hominis TaxID=2497989 RepID=UPI0024BCE990|nr:immunity 49 family protein [Candidatus Ornithobacterium hominis]CAI9429331.1 RES domain-containing protein [Candidatus Ornithobacterium hominis]
MKDLKKDIENSLSRQYKWLNHIENDFENADPMSLNFRFLERDWAVYEILNRNISKAKQHFCTASLLDKLRIEKFNNNMFDYELSAVTFPILSDNNELIKDYSTLRYKAWGRMPSMDENVLMGKSAIWCNTIQFFMVNDVQGVERNLNIIETLTLPKLPKNQQELKIDYAFYKALLAKDKAKCEELLEQLVSPKIHKKRNDNLVLNKYISQPALGYAKLAWRQGVEVEVNSSLVPKEILPIAPLDNYEIPYDFLKDEVK